MLNIVMLSVIALLSHILLVDSHILTFCSATTISIMTLSITTLSVMGLFATLSVMGLFATLNITVTSALCQVSRFFTVTLGAVMLNVIVLSVFMLSIVAPFFHKYESTIQKHKDIFSFTPSHTHFTHIYHKHTYTHLTKKDISTHKYFHTQTLYISHAFCSFSLSLSLSHTHTHTHTRHTHKPRHPTQIQPRAENWDLQ